jgi:hypothetical protein
VALVEQIGLGIYVGLLTGMFTALLIFLLAFLFQYVAGSPFPATMGLMIGLGAAGLQGGMMRMMREPQMLQSPVILTALLVVMLITNYSQKRATEMAKAAPPKSALFAKFRRKSLSPDVIKQLGRFGQVRIHAIGEVSDLEGYPPLPDDVRNAIREDEWHFPADLPIPELEKRLGEQLRIEHDLEDVAVDVDEKGQATISAAPPSGGISRRVPEGMQATSIETVVPTGLAYGDDVRIEFGDERVTGSVVSVKPPEEKKDEKKEEGGKKEGGAGKPKPAKTTAAGGESRVAVAVDRDDVPVTLTSAPTKFLARPRGRNREYELISLLRRDGNGFRRVGVTARHPIAEQTIGQLDLRGRHGVAILAIKRADEWFFAPGADTTIRDGDELFVTGPPAGLDAVAEGIS